MACVFAAVGGDSRVGGDAFFQDTGSVDRAFLAKWRDIFLATNLQRASVSLHARRAVLDISSTFDFPRRQKGPHAVTQGLQEYETNSQQVN